METKDKPLLSLPSQEKSFEINIIGEDTSTKFEGEFVYRRPSLRQKSEIAVTHARAKKDQLDLGTDMESILYITAFLKTTIVSAPKWFADSNGGIDLYDANVVVEIYLKCIDYEKEFKKQVFPETSEPVK